MVVVLVVTRVGGPRLFVVVCASFSSVVGIGQGDSMCQVVWVIAVGVVALTISSSFASKYNSVAEGSLSLLALVLLALMVVNVEIGDRSGPRR